MRIARVDCKALVRGEESYSLRIRARRTYVIGRGLISGATARHAPMMSASRLYNAVS